LRDATTPLVWIADFVPLLQSLEGEKAMAFALLLLIYLRREVRAVSSSRMGMKLPIDVTSSRRK